MNIKENFEKLKYMISDIHLGYSYAKENYLILRQSYESSSTVTRQNNQKIIVVARKIQESLYKSVITDLHGWLLDRSEHSASIGKAIEYLEKNSLLEHVAQQYSNPPKIIKLHQLSETTDWKIKYSNSRKDEFQKTIEEIKDIWGNLSNSEESRKLRLLRNKSIAHKDFKSNQLYDFSSENHSLKDIETIIKQADILIENLDKIINKTTLVPIGNISEYANEFWRSLKSKKNQEIHE